MACFVIVRFVFHASKFLKTYSFLFFFFSCLKIEECPLLENMFFTSVIYDFLHQFLIDVESIIVNISFLKLMLM